MAMFQFKWFSLLFLIFLNVSHAQSILLKPLNETPLSFEELKGKWVFINYWASWCQPCLDEIRELNQFYKTQKDRVQLFGVNYDMLPAQEQWRLIKKLHIHYPNLEEDPAKLLALGDIPGVPATFVFNPNGKLVKTLYGPQTFRSLNALIS